MRLDSPQAGLYPGEKKCAWILDLLLSDSISSLPTCFLAPTAPLNLLSQKSLETFIPKGVHSTAQSEHTWHILGAALGVEDTAGGPWPLFNLSAMDDSFKKPHTHIYEHRRKEGESLFSHHPASAIINILLNLLHQLLPTQCPPGYFKDNPRYHA